jgi:GAF domain-containing protein
LETIKELYSATQQITAEENILYALNKLLYKVMNVIGATDSSLSRLDEEAGELVFVLTHGDLSQQLPGFRIKSNTGIAGWVVQNRESIIINNPRQDWRFSEVVDKEFHFFTKSIVSVPIMRRDKFMGVIQFLNKRGSEFNEADVTLLLVLGLVAAIVIEEFQTRIEAGQADEEDF